jgi:hypothetical protein
MLKTIEAVEAKAVRIRMSNEVGALAKVLAPIAEAQVNVEAIDATSVNDEGWLTVVTDNNRKALELWEKSGWIAQEVNLINLSLPNKPGELATVVNRLGQAGIDIRYVYAASTVGDLCNVCLTTSDNIEALKIIRS